MENRTSYVQENKERFINELIELLKIPSVSADTAFSQDVLDTAEAVKVSLEKAGCDFVEICETAGYPIVYGEKIIDSNLPTILVYGHYDVQPADPIELWTSPPFEPVIKPTAIHPEGAIFARGACDDKGQMYMHVKAFEYMIQSNTLPCNVKFMIEGEEEVGSVNLKTFVALARGCGSAGLVAQRQAGSLEHQRHRVLALAPHGAVAHAAPVVHLAIGHHRQGDGHFIRQVLRALHQGLYAPAFVQRLNVRFAHHALGQQGLATHPGAVLAQSAQGVGVKPEGVRHYRSNWPLALDE